MRTGLVSRLLPSSAVDGPGNRFVVFLQGCGFNCRYCHNPETRAVCRACGHCVRACPAGGLYRRGAVMIHDPRRCRDCGRCVAACPHGSTPRARVMTVAAVAAAIDAARPFISGVTVSGGEPTRQAEFVAAVFAHARRRGLTTALETNGDAPAAVWRRFEPLTDLVLLDLKAYDPIVHRRLTGAENDLVLASARRLARRGKLTEVRTVVVPGRFDNVANVRAISRFLTRLGPALPYRLVGFRPHGVRGRLARRSAPTTAHLDALARLARRQGLRDVDTV